MWVCEVCDRVPRHQTGNCEVNACYREERNDCVDRTLQNIASTNPNQVAQPIERKLGAEKESFDSLQLLDYLGLVSVEDLPLRFFAITAAAITNITTITPPTAYIV